LTTLTIRRRAGSHFDHVTPQVIGADLELVHFGVELGPDALDILID